MVARPGNQGLRIVRTGLSPDALQLPRCYMLDAENDNRPQGSSRGTGPSPAYAPLGIFSSDISTATPAVLNELDALTRHLLPRLQQELGAHAELASDFDVLCDFAQQLLACWLRRWQRLRSLSARWLHVSLDGRNVRRG